MIFKSFSVATTNHGTLWLVHEKNEDIEPKLGRLIRGRLGDEFELSQDEGKCASLGINPNGSHESLRFGVFSDLPPTMDNIFGAYYLGCFYPESGTARLMGAFPALEGEKLSALHGDILSALLSTPLVSTKDDEVQLLEIGVAVYETIREINGEQDIKDVRAMALLDGVKVKQDLSYEASVTEKEVTAHVVRRV